MKKNTKTKIVKILLSAFVFLFALNFYVNVNIAEAAIVPNDDKTACVSSDGTDLPQDVANMIVDPNNTDQCIIGPTSPTGAFGGQLDDRLRGIAAVIVTIQSLLNRLIWPILILIGSLLDNSILFGSGMEDRMRDIWIPVRNIVNLLFVVALVGVALYNVLGLGDENSTFSLKAILPKLFIGVIAVNFSFLLMKVFIDAINVLTVSIFALPDQVGEGVAQVLTDEDTQIERRVCSAIQGVSASDLAGKAPDQIKTELVDSSLRKAQFKAANNLGVTNLRGTDDALTIENKIKEKAQNDGEDEAEAVEAWKTEVANIQEGDICVGTNFTPVGRIFLREYGAQNAAMALALNMGQIVFYEDISPSNIKQDIENLVVSGLFSIILYLVYMVSFLVLFIVLLARLVILWISLVLSPILLLGFAVPTIREKIGLIGDINDKFVQNAIAPLGIALSMSIGWIMLKSMQFYNATSTDISLLNSAQVGFPIESLGTLQTIIVALATVVIVWMGVFAAASKTIAEKVTSTIKTGLESAGAWVATAPIKFAPIIPVYDPSTGEWKKDAAPLAAIPETLRDIKNYRPQNIESLSQITGLAPGSVPGQSNFREVERAAQSRNNRDLAETIRDFDLSRDQNVAELRRIRDQNGASFDDLLQELRRQGRNGNIAADALEVIHNEQSTPQQIQQAERDLDRVLDQQLLDALGPSQLNQQQNQQGQGQQGQGQQGQNQQNQQGQGQQGPAATPGREHTFAGRTFNSATETNTTQALDRLNSNISTDAARDISLVASATKAADPSAVVDRTTLETYFNDNAPAGSDANYGANRITEIENNLATESQYQNIPGATGADKLNHILANPNSYTNPAQTPGSGGGGGGAPAAGGGGGGGT